MSKRTTGALFCLIATLLYCTKYLSAAFYGSKIVLNERTFSELLTSVGRELTFLSIISLLIGVFYLFSAELHERRH